MKFNPVLARPDFDAPTREAWRGAITAINTQMKKGAGY